MARASAPLGLLLAFLLTIPATAAVGWTAGGDFQAPAAPAGGSGSGNETRECGGRAPLEPVCTTGLHVREGPSFGLGLSAVNYDGVLESRLDWEEGSAVLRCEVHGAQASCERELSGPFPRDGTRVVHDCRSLDPATGLPGGEGAWSCSFTD